MTDQPVLRFAPSPNGPLHLGHARSALIGYEMARRLGGRFLVRIEDIDIARSRPEHIAAILEDLDWLGIAWEQPVRRQSEHFDDYRAAAARLEAAGLLYPCFATRSEIALAADPDAADPDGVPLYTGLHKALPEPEIMRRKAAGQSFALRIDMAEAVRRAVAKQARPLEFTEMTADGILTQRRVAAERWGDAIIVRKDLPTSYHLAVVVDDACQGVTHVTRGQDLFAATDIHRVLQTHLDLPAPIYHHHTLILDEAGRKLSKSLSSTALASLRAEGLTARDIRRLAGVA